MDWAIVVAFFVPLLFTSGVLKEIMRGRRERRLQAEAHRQRMVELRERTRIAELEQDAIKLLLADKELGIDFQRRLSAALEVDGAKPIGALPDPNEKFAEPKQDPYGFGDAQIQETPRHRRRSVR